MIRDDEAGRVGHGRSLFRLSVCVFGVPVALVTTVLGFYADRPPALADLATARFWIMIAVAILSGFVSGAIFYRVLRFFGVGVRL